MSIVEVLHPVNSTIARSIDVHEITKVVLGVYVGSHLLAVEILQKTWLM